MIPGFWRRPQQTKPRGRPRGKGSLHTVLEHNIPRDVPPSLFTERDARRERDFVAAASDTMVALGFDPPPHRSALAKKVASPIAARRKV
jgi:hypothetical protein